MSGYDTVSVVSESGSSVKVSYVRLSGQAAARIARSGKSPFTLSSPASSKISRVQLDRRCAQQSSPHPGDWFNCANGVGKLSCTTHGC